jgi:hypothetical protein
MWDSPYPEEYRIILFSRKRFSSPLVTGGLPTHHPTPNLLTIHRVIAPWDGAVSGITEFAGFCSHPVRELPGDKRVNGLVSGRERFRRVPLGNLLIVWIGQVS